MKFEHLMEVGCDGKASLHHFLTPENRLDVIECNPNHLFEVNRNYGNSPNVKIHPYAMWHTPGMVQFNLEGASSYVEGVKGSPCMVNDNIMPIDRPDDWRIQVEARTFDEFDDGTIDIMDLDIEGAEWYVISRMISRPKVVIIEMESQKYVNPHFNDINKWMSDNHYCKFHQDKSCTFYKRLI